ncbi:MAG: amylo-alpha-1,6-glucosidase [Candidatus Limivivens sp.]|nr:amylo-alpha-1,6-glucosidase [Candidatus Limivivens sp.]
MSKAFWIWYPGDFEIYHGMLQNFSREERGFRWPAYWHLDDCCKNVRYARTYELEREETFQVFSHAHAYVRVNRKKYRLGETISCGPGAVTVEIYAGCPEGIPAVLVEGEAVFSDGTWNVDDFLCDPKPVGYNVRYTRREQNPSFWEYEEKDVAPVSSESVKDGVLYEFQTEIVAGLKLNFPKGFHPVTLCYGESRTEALDVENCYFRQSLASETEHIPVRAFRFLYLPDACPGEVEVTAEKQYVDLPSKSFFCCDNEMLNRIWKTAEETFQLCSGVFFLDGVKRDRWIWSGDAYQSYFINRYLMFDEDIARRTMWALRGKDPVQQHINTIVDYSMYWVISIRDHYEMTGDRKFVEMIYPRMQSMMEFLEKQLDDRGFLVGRPGDWIFIDWADMDKTGAVCAEQMLLARCCESMAELAALIGKEDAGDYQKKYEQLKEDINRCYWDEKKSAYIDSFSSGRNHVSRHANIFAILFEIADQRQAEEIYQKVLCSPDVPPITTPYFKFFELEVLCRMGREEEVLSGILDYWGGMLSEGAVTFWEEYDPEKQGEKHYEMYGDPYGKSLCHAWGASPIYLIGRYFMGVRPTAPAYGHFLVEPKVSLFKHVHCRFPLKGGWVEMTWDQDKLKVLTNKEGGTLRIDGGSFALRPGQELEMTVGGH